MWNRMRLLRLGEALEQHVNELEPYAFYIVDSFGMMKRKDLTRLFYLVEHNLNEKFKIGFHSHNNMQLAYSNAQSLVDLHSDVDVCIANEEDERDGYLSNLPKDESL